MPSADDYVTEKLALRASLPWRALGAAIAALGTSVSVIFAEPILGHAIAAVEVGAFLVVIGTALFGSRTLSERAFRLLRYIADRPEPLQHPRRK
jgi:hypothetical protein